MTIMEYLEKAGIAFAVVAYFTIAVPVVAMVFTSPSPAIIQLSAQ